MDREQLEREDAEWFSDRVPVFKPSEPEYEDSSLFKWEKLTAIGNGLLAALAALVTAFTGLIALWQAGLLENLQNHAQQIKKEVKDVKTEVKNLNTKVDRHLLDDMPDIYKRLGSRDQTPHHK